MDNDKRYQQNLKSMADGSLGGKVRSAAPIRRPVKARATPRLDRVIFGKGIRWVTIADTEPDVTTYNPSNQNDLWVDTSGLKDQPVDLVEITPYALGATSASAVRLFSGAILYIWSNGSQIVQGRADNMEAFTGGSASVILDRVLFDTLSLGRCAVAWESGRLLLTTFWWSQAGDNIARGRVYQSINEGQSWELLSEFNTQTGLAGVTVFAGAKTLCGPIRKLDNGTLLMAASQVNTSRLGFNETKPDYRIWRSTNNGVTWTATLLISSVAMAYPKHMTRTIGGSSLDLYVSTFYLGSVDKTRIYRSVDRGVTWTLVNEFDGSTAFSDSYSVVHVAPHAKGEGGYSVTSLGWQSRIKRWLVQNMSDPVAQWEQIGGMSDWSPDSPDHHHALIQEVDGQDLLFIQGVMGTNLIVGSGFAALNLWDVETGKWVPVASARIVEHTHAEYSLSGHNHAALALADLTDVDSVAPALAEVLTWDGDSWAPAAIGGGGASALDDLTDVDLVTTPPVDGNVIAFDVASGLWVPGAGGGGGGGADNPVYIQAAQPTAAAPWLWVKTSDEPPTLWVEDGA